VETLATLKPLGYEIINLGSDQPVGLKDVIRLIERLVDREARVEFKPRHAAGVTSTWAADISKAKRLLEWPPKIGFGEGIRQLVSWCRENRNWAKDVKTE